MLGPRPVRRLVAVTATLGVAAALTAGISAGASAVDGAVDGAAGATDRTVAQEAPGVAVREARQGGSFLVRGGALTAQSIDPDRMADLRTYARTSGEDLDALVASHAGVDELAAYLDGLAQRRPDSYVTGGVASPEDGDTAWVQFTERPGAAEIARMRALPVDLRVSFGAPASYAELEQLSEDLIDTAGDDPAIDTAVAGYDPEAQVMELTWSGTSQAEARGSSVLGRVTAEVAEALPGDELPLEVVGAVGAEGLQTMQKVAGGRELLTPAGGACTAGFTARRKGSLGVVTSGHCPNFMLYQGKRGILQKAVTTRNNIDVQWHRTRTGNGHVTVAKFRERAGKPDRIVRRVANAPRGSVVCKYGRTTYFTCGKIRRTNICAKFTNGEKYCRLDMTGRSISQPGDSGGPNFLGTSARGITTGGTDQFSVLTRAGAIKNVRGIKLMTKAKPRKKGRGRR